MPRLLRIAVFVLALLVPASGSADAIVDFERAEVAYREQRFASAATMLEALIASAEVAPVDPAIVLESRKYLAACYLFLGRSDDADRQFELLLGLDPEYRVDPVVFPRAVVERFDAVRLRIEGRRDAEREAARVEAERLLAAERRALATERQRYAQLYDVASNSPVYRRNSRVLAFLPFGLGQFQNGRRRLGRFFAVAESLTFGIYVTGLVWYRAIEGEEVRDADELRWNRSIDAARALNWSGFSLFAGLALIGAVEAEVNFEPIRTSSRPRPLPEELRPVQTTVSLSPERLVLTLRF